MHSIHPNLKVTTGIAHAVKMLSYMCRATNAQEFDRLNIALYLNKYVLIGFGLRGKSHFS